MFALVSNGLSDVHCRYQICTCYLVLITKFAHFAILCVLSSAGFTKKNRKLTKKALQSQGRYHIYYGVLRRV